MLTTNNLCRRAVVRPGVISVLFLPLPTEASHATLMEVLNPKPPGKSGNEFNPQRTEVVQDVLNPSQCP